MKKNYFKILGGLFLSLFISVQSFAQLGTDVYTLGLDNSNNYGGNWITTSAGTGFGNWAFDEATTNGGAAGRFLGSFSSALDVSSNSFGLYANSENNAASGASRLFPKSLEEGDVFKISVGVNFRDGAKGFDLRNTSNNSIVNFNVAADKYTIAGVDLYSNIYNANTVITFTFTQNATIIDWTAVRSGGLSDTQSGTINSINAGTITNLRLYNVSAGTNNDGGSGQRNLYFNSFEFTSKYTINNNSSVNVTSTTTAPYLRVEAGSTVTVEESANGLTVSGNLTNNGTVNLNSGSSLIVNGTSTGNVTYTRNLPTSNWYLVSSPVSGQAYDDDYVTANEIASGTGSNRGIATYTTTDNTWSYLVSGGSGTFDNGKGYSVKRASAGDISFTGTINTSNVSVAVSNGFNLVGNPFTASLNLGDFFADNGAAGAISGAQTWFWNGSSYDVKTSGNHGTFEIAPGQGFFVNAAGDANLTFNISNVSHTIAVFQKTNPRPEITLTLTEGSDTRNAYIYYVNGTTIDYDLGYDGNLFGGVSHSLAVYSHLVNNDNGNKYQLQSLPDSNYENMVIPIGIIAAAGKEITFTAEALNLPGDTKVFLEDRLTNTVTRLDEANTSYKVTLSEDANGTGRFYLHTKASGVLSTADVTLENISVFATNNGTLRIVGLPSGKSNLKLYNILGKQVMQTTFTSTGAQEISLPKLSTGVYFVQLESEAGKLNKKIVLE